MAAVLACHNLTRVYGRGTQAESAIVQITLSFAAGETCVMLGPSGSGSRVRLILYTIARRGNRMQDRDVEQAEVDRGLGSD